MSYSSGILEDVVTILNRKDGVAGQFGMDSGGITWEDVGYVHASVDWTRGKQAMNAGALDVYGVIIVRMRWNGIISERSRIVHEGKTYQILGDTFHADKRGNTIQFHAQALINGN